MVARNFIRQSNMKNLAFRYYDRHSNYVQIDDEVGLPQAGQHRDPIQNDDAYMQRRKEIIMAIINGNN